MGLAMVCESCQKNRHEMCGNPEACVCAKRGHPERPAAAGTVIIRDNPANGRLFAWY